HVRKVTNTLYGQLVITLGNDEYALGCCNAREERSGSLGRRNTLDSEGLDDVQALAAETVAKCASEGSSDHLLGGALRVIAWLRTVYDTTAAVLRHPDRTLTGVTRALL